MAVLTLIMTSGMGPLMIRSFKLEQERRKSMKWVKGQEVGKLHSFPPHPTPVSGQILALIRTHLDSVDLWRLRVQMLLHRVFLRTGIELRVLSHSL